MSQPYRLLYHPGLPGRGEFVRLYFEATGSSPLYVDEALGKDGSKAMKPYLDGKFDGSETNPIPFAVPALVDNSQPESPVVLYQTANILLYLSTKLPEIDLDAPAPDAAADDEPKSKKAKVEGGGKVDADFFHKNALMLSIMDAVQEVHDTHHPTATMDYYENQKDAAQTRTKAFREGRLPKMLGHLEANLAKSGNGFLLPSGVSFADLGLYQLVDGLLYAFPRLMAKFQKSNEYPLTFKLHKTISAAPRIKSYLESDRRQDYSTYGIFRAYPELDEPEE